MGTWLNVLMSATKHVSVRLPIEIIAELDEEAKRLDRSRAWVILRRIINSRATAPVYYLDSSVSGEVEKR